jgi:16S rRNA U1498 N3-methylase RsmE
MKQIVRLTEGDLHRIVKESVKKILKEYNYDAVRSVYELIIKASMLCQQGDIEGAVNILVGSESGGTSVESELLKHRNEIQNAESILRAVRNAANQGSPAYMSRMLKVIKRMVGENFSNERGDIPLRKRMGE